MVASCVVALIGALRTGRGSLRMGGALFLVSVAGIAAAVVLFAVVQAIVVAPRNPGMPTSPNALFYVSSLAPVPLLLFGAALTLRARRERATTGDV